MRYLFIAASLLFITTRFTTNPSDTNWVEYNGDGARSHYSSLTQIDASTVHQLKVAWTYASGGADTVGNRTQMQCNPIVIDGILYGVSANTQVFALDAATGQEIWQTSLTDNGGTTSRGVTYWADGQDKRILFGAGKWLYAVNAETGKPIDSFGKAGRIDLKEGIERPGGDNYVQPNTPNTIYKNLIIVGARLSEGETALLGDVRAYDVRTGRKIWTFHTIPQPSEFGYDTWAPANPRQRLGGANAWAGMAIDRQRGIVYIPTGSAAYDFYGGNRKGNNLFANCLLALDATTGKRLWHFQFVHHDIWDRDPPAPPSLLTVTQKGPDGRPRRIDAVAQTTKQGHVFVFDRVSGKPLFSVAETAFSGDAVMGEQTSRTQPIPQKPAPFTKQTFTEKDINSWASNRDEIVATLRKARTGSPYIPLTSDMTIFFPGTDGGAQWGGSAVDPEGIIYIPAKQNPCFSTLVRKEQPAKNASVTGAQLYSLRCSSCHGTDRKGNHDGSYPSLLGLAARLSTDAVQQVLLKGRGMMPSFSHLPEAERKAIVDFLFNKGTTSQPVSSAQNGGLPYQHTGYNRWYDSKGYPVSAPPWGTLTAIDLNTGEHRWQVPLGEYKELTAKGIPPTGTDNYGGPLVTGSGLLFIAASKDEQFRAMDKKTGKILWQVQLPAAGYASPSTYSVGGKQYVVIACGGGKLNTKSGDKYVAFALP
ncbi:outer membrane protein assembly factor BamB family protein [Spirosoma endophyticum]|uniref:Quinoprotein glucose dehydrogenase n=1 Tax=Spirosoma endophyticum TaxID=662367 RepID=A0A1I1HXZ8_9BACT|nr:PQQ-binding-like beta-propeller repeat protein [Spirosoma endophyticum]SFC28814.1 quinoprotein glucose dehydrogenase [Spirosoma endophyticum]